MVSYTFVCGFKAHEMKTLKCDLTIGHNQTNYIYFQMKQGNSHLSLNLGGLIMTNVNMNTTKVKIILGMTTLSTGG